MSGEVNSTTQQLTSPRPAASSVVFDIPALLRQSVAQVKASLGPPIDELQANVTDTERSLVYKRNGLVLTVDYFIDRQNIEVISLTGERDTTTFQHLLQLGNLSQTSTAYTIDTLRSEKARLYRGIAVSLNLPSN